MNLDKLNNRGFSPKTILDIGAHLGTFHDLAKTQWPEANIHMVEANEHILPFINIPDADYTIALLGDEEKEVDFYMTKENPTNTGASIYKENTEHYSEDKAYTVKKQMTTLDSLFESDVTFDLIKIDTQGSEIDIIKGGLALCKRAKYIILEVSSEEYNKGAPLKDEVLSFMEELGFTPEETLGKPHPTQEDIAFINNNTKNLRFHIHGLHHTQTNKYFNSCAFTMQIHAMCDMLTKAGYEVYHYGNEGSDPNCTENITIASEKERYDAFPFADYRHAPPRLSGEHANTGYLAAPEFCDEWDKRTIKEIKKKIRPNDFILNFCNTEYMNISSAFEDTAILVEPGIGYAGGCPNTRKVYVSHAWQAFHDGWNARGITDYTEEDTFFGKPEIQDAVIHYFIDEEDFEYSKNKENYAFFIGRFNEDKGVTIALRTCEQYRKETGDKSFKLKMAGPGSDWFVNLLTEKQKEWVEVLGFVEPDEKKKLLRKAKVLFAPSLYNEPFGAISIEAQISGTPVISTDWGGFTESVIHGKTGYRCRNFEHFVWALKNIDKINSKDCYTWASNNFTKKAMTPKYIDYFEGLYRIRTNDTYWWTLNKDRRSLDTCQMNYPQ